MIRTLALCGLCGCNVQPRGIQLAAGDLADIERGFACESSMLGPVDDVVTLDPANTMRLQTFDDDVVVFVGSLLDTPFTGDPDLCDDLFYGSMDTQRITMAYTTTDGTVTVSDDGVGRSVAFDDVVFTPDPTYAAYAPDFDPEDVELVEPFTFSGTVGVVQRGGTIEPLL